MSSGQKRKLGSPQDRTDDGRPSDAAEGDFLRSLLRKRAKLDGESLADLICGYGARVIASLDDLDPIERELCDAILESALEALSPQARVTTDMRGRFLSQIFDKWTSKNRVESVTEMNQFPIQHLDGNEWSDDESTVRLGKLTRGKSKDLRSLRAF